MTRTNGDHHVVWQPAAGAQRFNVFRASLDEARNGSFGTCPLSGTSATSWIDADTPTSGETFTYWIQGVSAACGPGTVGYDSKGRDRGAPLCP